MWSVERRPTASDMPPKQSVWAETSVFVTKSFRLNKVLSHRVPSQITFTEDDKKMYFLAGSGRSCLYSVNFEQGFAGICVTTYWSGNFCDKLLMAILIVPCAWLILYCSDVIYVMWIVKSWFQFLKHEDNLIIRCFWWLSLNWLNMIFSYL